MSNNSVPARHPEATKGEEGPAITLAHDLPVHMLLNAISHVGMHLLDCADIGSVTLVGARRLPILDGHQAVVPGELVLCTEGCCALSTGTYTLVSDTEMLELLANYGGRNPIEIYPRCWKFGRSDGRTCYVVPADEQTMAPWVAL